MNQHLNFEIQWEQMESGQPEESATFASLGIRANGRAITRVEDRLARTTREVIRVSAYPLAMWLAANWWRLRWEGSRTDHEWSMTHCIPAVGSGYLWPDLRIVSQGDFVKLSARETVMSDIESIGFLGNFDISIPAESFVSAIDSFIETVIRRLSDSELPDTDLQQLWTIVQEERRDSEQSKYRRYEALLGFDPDEGPAESIGTFIELGDRLGVDAVAESVAGAATVDDINKVESVLQSSESITVQDLSALRNELRNAGNNKYPWQLGEDVARKVRQELGQPQGPLVDATLEDWLSMQPNHISNPSSQQVPFAAGLRENPDSKELRIAFRSSWQTGRRFEIARLVADYLISAPTADLLIPATRAETARQKTQRAFAAELLLPWAELQEHIGDKVDDDEQIEELAAEYYVSPLLVYTRLASKGRLNENPYMLTSSPNYGMEP